MKIIKFIIKLVIGIVLTFALATIAINAVCVLGTRDDVRTVAQVESRGIKADAIVVLGASVFSDGTPSDILADRLDVAIDLYNAGAAPAIIVSGYNSDSYYDEPDSMKAYCVSKGVPENAVYVDRYGNDTYASIYRACNVYGAKRLLVVTQAYHLYRALMIGKILGADTIGVAADKGEYENQRSNSLRDYLARDKDFVRAILKIPPQNATQPMTM